MSLCFDLGSVLEGHPDVVLAVKGDVVHHRQPVCFPELRQRLPVSQLFQVGFDLVPSGRALGNQVCDLGVSGLGLIEPGYPGEINPSTTRTDIGDHIVQELEIARISSNESTIKEMSTNG